MRLLVLTPEFDLSGGGIATFYHALAPALVEAGISVHVVEGSAFHSTPDRHARTHMGATVETLRSEAFERRLRHFGRYAAMPETRRHLAAAWAMWDQANAGHGFDIVEASDWGLLFAPPILDGDIPVVAQLHGSVGQIGAVDPVAGQDSGDALIRLMERDIVRRAPELQTLSRANAAFWQTQSAREATVIRPAWRAREPSSRAELSGRGLVVGRVQNWKGPHVASEALRRLGAGAPGIDWIGRDVTYGARDGSTLAHLRTSYPDVWDAKIAWRPPIPSAEVWRAQSRALFNLAPSTWDVFNFTVVEAMASGRPVICSTAAGASELVEDGVNGYLFESGNPDALAAAITLVLGAKSAELASIGRAARETVETTLAPKAVAATRIAAYRRAVADFKPRPRADRDWLDAACRPDEKTRYNEWAFLDHLPLTRLLRHAGRRTLRKVLRRG